MNRPFLFCVFQRAIRESPLLFILRSRISSRSDFIHRRWLSSVGEGVPRRQDIIAWAAKPTPGRGFEEVHERKGQRPKSVLHKCRAKTPLRGIEKGSTLFALPSEGSNPFCWGVFGGCGGLFPKSPPQKPRVFFKSPLEQSRVPHKKPAPCLDDLRKKSAFLAKFDPFP